MPKKTTKRKLAVIDLETDPFEFGTCPEPFLSGFYDGDRFITIWDEKACIARTVEMLAKEETPTIIYAHNGGRFDFFYFLPYLSRELKIVNGRIIQSNLGEHELRDSYALMPFPLKAYNKLDIDYAKLHRDNRAANRDEIIEYLHGDCQYLHELVVAFHEEFGDNLTIGGTAMKQIKRFHAFKSGNEKFDGKFRKPFYYGGRVQVFESGIIRRPLKVYDVNSMYPHVMEGYLHPVGTASTVSKSIEKTTCFVVAEGKNYGAFPVRNEKTGGLDFTQAYGKFSVTIHEWNAALETGCFEPHKIHKTYGFDNRISFAEFVSSFYDARKTAKRKGDKTRDLFYKFILNSGYGKFAQNPNNYFDWQITEATERPEPQLSSECPNGWSPAYIHQGNYIIWQRPAQRHQFYNVCTGASITGAARAVLLRGLNDAVHPVYCDTDSIICESMRSVDVDHERLGAWKLECEAGIAAIAGKKCYALFSDSHEGIRTAKEKAIQKGITCPESFKQAGREIMTVKKAHKGARLTGQQILRIAQGDIVNCTNPVPRFGLDGKNTFTVRNIRRTHDAENDYDFVKGRRIGRSRV